MVFSNEGQSFYHRFHGSFLSDKNEKPMHCTGSPQQWLQHNWNSILSNSVGQEQSNVKIDQKDSLETQHSNTAVVANGNPQHPAGTAFEEFFAQLIFSQADLCASQSLSRVDNDSSTQEIVGLFDSFLRYQGKDDRWVHGGRAYFTEHVRHFTSQNAPIEFCLPAFPCKSSNIDKVTGPDPDRGEELALERLHCFVEAIEHIYQPGAKMWIISDGHVFSDCIGVDDATVDAYGEKLKAMSHAIGSRRGDANRVGFKSLVDLFRLAAIGSDAGLLTLAHRLNIPTIDHHVNTKVTEEAELCRRILMAGCGPQKSAVRATIDSKDPAITALYRGFSRFMLEDLEHHPHTQGMTRSQQKKLSAKVAFEMILRNQAYSNLVELLFPNHVRLSIHAHNNAGPKFGIQLFDPTKVRAVNALSADGELMTSLDLLHIPTPWHNSVVQLDGSDVVLVTKAKLARAALDAGSTAGGLVGTEEGRAYFSLQGRGATDTQRILAVPPAPDALSKPKVAEMRTEKDRSAVTVTVTVAVEEKDTPARPTCARRTTFSEKADAMVTAVVRRNTGSSSTGAEPCPAKHGSWLGRLRWVLSLFWPRGM